MNLQAIAEQDLVATLETDGQTIKLTSPDSVTVELQAVSNDIGLMLDPETGVPVSGRNCNCTLRISSILAAGMVMPRGIEDGEQLPWIVEYTTVNGETISAKVIASNPDRSLGVISLRLELIE